MVQLHTLETTCRVSRSQIPEERAGEIISLVSLVASDADEDVERKPLYLVIVLDKSGSMAGEKLELVKSTMEFIVKTGLSEKDRLGVITFDSNITTVFKLSHLTHANKMKCLEAIQTIRADSNTNLSGGLFAGVQMLLDTSDWSERTGVCVLTDGQMNEGITNKDKLIQMLSTMLRKFEAPPTVITTIQDSMSGFMTGMRTSLRNLVPTVATTTTTTTTSVPSSTTSATAATSTSSTTPIVTKTTTHQRSPPAIFTFGFGKDASVDVLTEIASSTGGNYYSILSTEAVPLAFSDALGGLLSVAAQNIQVYVKVEGATGLTPLTKLAFEQPTSTSAMLKLKDMYSGEHRDVLFRVPYGATAANTNKEQGNEIKITVEVHYIDAISEIVDAKCECETHVVRLPGKNIDHEKIVEDVEIKRHMLRWETTVALEEARKAGDAGDLTGGQKTIDNTMSRLASAMNELHVTEEDDDMLHELNNDLRTAKNGLRSTSFYAQARGKMAAASYSHAQQRSNKTEELLDIQSSSLMQEMSSQQKKQVSSTYSNPTRNGFISKAKAAFDLS